MTKTFTLYWIREDKQGDYNMGSFETEAAAWAAKDAAYAELIGQCPGPNGCDENLRCVAEIGAGTWTVLAG